MKLSASDYFWRTALAERLLKLADFVESSRYTWEKACDMVEAAEWDLARARCTRCGDDRRSGLVTQSTRPNPFKWVCEDEKKCAARVKRYHDLPATRRQIK